MKAIFKILLVLVLGFSFPLSAKVKKETKNPIIPEISAASQDVKIIVNIPSKTLTLYQNGEAIKEFPIAVGQPSFKTPVGERSLNQIVWNPWWIPPSSAWAKNDKPTPPGPYNPLGPVKMKLGTGIMMHGTSNENSIGTAASHGCLRMYNKDAAALAWWIQTHFSNEKDPSLKAKYQKNSKTSYYVNLKKPIPVELRYDLFKIVDGKVRVHPDIYWKVGNKAKALSQWLATQGYDVSNIDEKNLEKTLKASAKQVTEMPLKTILSPAQVARQ